MIEKMDKKTEHDIIASIREAIGLANGGMTPSAAIAKVASDRGYNKNFVARMVEAFNVSKTLSHLKEAKGDARASAVPLAEVDEVSHIMYPATVATPAEKSASEWVPVESLMTETRFFNLANAPRLNKKSTDVHSWRSRNPDMLLRGAYGEVDYMTRRLEDLRHVKEAVKFELMDGIRKLGEYFRSTRHEPFERLESAARQHYGDSVIPVMDMVWSISNPGRFGEKRASAAAKVAYKDPSPYLMLENIVEKKAAYIDAEQAWNKLAAEMKAFKDSVDLRARLLAKSSVVDVPSVVGGVLAERALSDVSLTPSLYETLLAATESLQDPNAEAERKSIHARMMLRDFMKNDEVLSRADPNLVVQAFNELSSVAPAATESPANMRVLLRKAVEQGQFDPLELANIMNIEKTVREFDRPGVLGESGRVAASKPSPLSAGKAAITPVLSGSRSDKGGDAIRSLILG